MLDVGPIQFWGAGFFDWGALADSYGAFHSSNFRTSAGFGLRLLLYGSVPIRLDYGFKLERRCKIPDLDTGVCLEEESPGEFDFNLLYTF
jgi:outer membrane protein assembly factor BamA